MPQNGYSQEIIRLLESVSNRRARIVIRHILEHGSVTTEELEKQYGYDHSPRAARDVREAGIPLETTRVRSSDGRWIAAYRFGDLSRIRQGKLRGRRAFPKRFKAELYERSGGLCAICAGEFESRYLQIDHRIPYEVAGEDSSLEQGEKQFMLLCGPCNRAKSWSCEHCPNWLDAKLLSVCSTCYWANPENYVHIALREVRRVDILWSENEVQTYERLKSLAQEHQVPIPEYVKKIIARYLEE